MGLPFTLCRLARDRRGTAILEFGLAAPVVVLSVAGLIELAMVMFVTSLMEGGIRDASRYGITGYVPAGTTREDQIKKLISDATIGLVDMTTAVIETKVYPSFNDVGKPEPFTDANANGVHDPAEPYTDVNGNGNWDADMGKAGLGGPNDIVLYTFTADWNLLTPLMTPLMGTAGKMRLSTSVAVRNEPF